MKRLGLLALGGLALNACNYGLSLSPDPADPGDTVTVTNDTEDGFFCVVPDGDDSVPVDIVLASGDEDEEEDFTIVSTTTDADGFFTVDLIAPDIPGQHLVAAFCGGIAGPAPVDELEALAAAEPVDEDGVILDLLQVTQAPLTIELDKTTAKIGEEVVATFNRCQDENDFDFAGEVAAAHEDDAVTPEELSADFPDLVVYLDGSPVATVAGEERYPTGTVGVPVELTSAGVHEIKGICTYQTFDLDLEGLLEEGFGDGPVIVEGGSVGAAHIEYPVVIDGFATFGEATTEAAATVTVGAAAAAVAVPVQPAFTG